MKHPGGLLMWTTIITTVSSGVLVPPFLGSSGTTALAAGDSSAALKAAQELTQLMMSKEAYSDSIKQMSTAMLQTMAASTPSLPEDAAAKVSAAVEEAMPFKELMAWNAEIYAARFSVDELKALITFYKTPVGKKLAKLLPELMGEVGTKMGTVLPERLPAAMKKHGLVP